MNMMTWWRKKPAPRKPTVHVGHSVQIGSFVDSDTGRQYVALSIAQVGAILSVQGAKLLSQQMADWAEIAEKRNEGLPAPGWEVVTDFIVKSSEKLNAAADR